MKFFLSFKNSFFQILTSQMNSAVSIGFIAFLFILIVIFGVLTYLKYKAVKTCETSEHNVCPSYYCSTTDADCANVPFRVVDGVKVCQTYVGTEGAAKITGF